MQSKVKMRCCVPFCESSREDASQSATTTKQIGLYAFPCSRSELASWLRALGKRGSVPAGAAVCSRHFLHEDICGDGQLRACAVPTTVQVCMICLDMDRKMFSMGNYNLKEAYEHLTGHPLFDVGNLKHTLCVECAQQLSNFEKFRDKSLRARAVMMDLVKQHEVITMQHITALQPLKTILAQTLLGAEFWDQHILGEDRVKIEDSSNAQADYTIDAQTEDSAVTHAEDSSDAQAVDSVDAQAVDSARAQAEVKKEPDVHMAWESSDAQAEDSAVTHAEDSSDAQEVDSVDAQAVDSARAQAEVKKEPDVHMACESSDAQAEDYAGSHAEESSDAQAVDIADTQAEVKTEPDVHMAWDSSDDSILRDTKLLDQSLCRVVLTRMSRVVERALAARGQLECESVPLQCTQCGAEYSPDHEHVCTRHNTTRAREGFSTAEVTDKKRQVFEEEHDDNEIDHTASKSDSERINVVLKESKRTGSKEAKSLARARSRSSHETDRQKDNVAQDPYCEPTTHNHGKPFTCNFCQYKCYTNTHLTKHMRLHTGEKPFACKVCRQTYTDEGNLVRHMKTHTHEKPFTCDFCQYNCTSKSVLVKHMRTQHTGEKLFACQLCRYKFKKKSQLVIHMRTHTGEKPFTCNFCQYKSTIRSSLVTHMKTHTKEKPFACNFCQYKFSVKHNLVRHMRTHTGEKPLACQLCQYKCAFKSYLTTHMRIHTGEKPFACQLCQYKCSTKSCLVRHLKTHR